MNNNTNPKKYVVLDVETNGLSSIEDDLLSISIYKPDDKKIYNRFLPLELEKYVYTTYINGITEKILKNKKPLTQQEFDKLIVEFELEKRTILTYGSLDEKFIKNYLKRKKISGFEKLNFFNFKRNIISSRFSEGNITKDNLCKLYNIANVKKVHSGENDCILEWQLFEKMNGKKLIIIHNIVYELNDEYVIPVSYLTNYTNFKYCINNLPKIKWGIKEVKKFRLDSKEIKKFENNINGITIEHLINSLLNVRNMNIETINYLNENKRKLKRIGCLASEIQEIPIELNSDGTISAISGKDEELIERINKVTNAIKKNINPVIKYLKEDLFGNETIMSQELVINETDKVLAKCDLSTKNKVLEIKTFIPDIEKYKYQLYYESNGREIYLFQTTWNNKLKKGLIFTIYKVDLYVNSNVSYKKIEGHVPRKNNSYFKKKVDIKAEKYLGQKGNKWAIGCLKFRNNDIFNYKYVRDYIKDNKISIKDIADALEVNESTIRNWINGKSRPYVWNAMAICTYLNIDEKDVIQNKIG